MSIEEQMRHRLQQTAADMKCPDDLYERVWASSGKHIPQRLSRKEAARRGRIYRKPVVALIVAAALFLIVVASGFVSPVMAKSLKSIPLVNGIFKLAGDLGLKTAAEKGLTEEVHYSDSHDGITVNVKEVMYDGIRAVVAIQREAPGTGSYFHGNYRGADGTIVVEPEGTKAVLRNVKLYANGEALNQTLDDPANPSPERGAVTWVDGGNADSVLINFMELSKPGQELPKLPESFGLTLELTLSGVEEVYTIEVPVKKNTNNVVVSPEISNEYEGIQLTLVKAELSPISTKITLAAKATDHESAKDAGPGAGGELSKIQYELFDEQGQMPGQLSSQGEYRQKVPVLYQDLIYEPFASTPRQFTIRPYLYVFKDGKASGEFKLDEHGMPLKNYIKELEMTVQVP
ncbi:DUF4179 domain-containing protein [Paenibacillus albidus]|uniref:DUF4179 domain-containing protein n=1 Tax=Paenibacillus albidus TaxID=2041023 RepID=UPI001BE61B35|nr:DUF4179 domain-containing protein [Paenibacillus albidus]MBT2291942.1 DUF4179 domain-containing protein [Paenibacillus albidus]